MLHMMSWDIIIAGLMLMHVSHSRPRKEYLHEDFFAMCVHSTVAGVLERSFNPHTFPSLGWIQV